MLPAMTSVSTHCIAFLSWWRDELTSMLPKWLTQSNLAVADAIVLVDSDGLRLLDEQQSDTGPDGGLPQRRELLPVLTPAEISARLTGTLRSNAAVTVGLRIPNTFCFSRTLELPSSAVEDFPNLLALDMERATPFRTSDTFSGYLIEARSGGQPNKTRLRQFIVKRSLLEGVISSLEAGGLRVGYISCWNEAGTAPLAVELQDVTLRQPQRTGSTDLHVLLQLLPA